MTAANGTSGAHPLQTPWALYYDSKKTVKAGGAWLDSLVHAHTVASVEEFWAMVCTVKKPSQIEIVAHPNPNYHFFRQGIQPQWEDAANKEGGRWIINLTKDDDLKNTDFVWEEVLMALVGEYLDDGDLITGAVFSKRRGLLRVSVWTRATEAKALTPLLQLATKLRTILQLPLSVPIEFLPHAASEDKAPVATIRA